MPFPQGSSRLQPLATAPLNDTPLTSTHQRTKPADNRKRAESAYTTSQQTRPSQLTRFESGPQKRPHDYETKQRDDRSIGSASTIESDTRPTTTEFPSYESFQQLRDSRNSRLIDGRVERPLQRPYKHRQVPRGDSSDEEENDGNGRIYARRPILDRPRPRSTHFVDFDDAQLSFHRTHEVENRLRRQSTRRSLELGRFRMHEKDDAMAGLSETSFPTQDVANGRGKTSAAFESRGSNIRLREDEVAGVSRGGAVIMRRGSEMITRSRDDVIEAKVVLLGSQGEFSHVLPSDRSAYPMKSGVGKTSLAKRYTEGVFSAHPATVNASLFTRKSVHDGVAVRLQIWDTCGEGWSLSHGAVRRCTNQSSIEKHRSLTKLYYRGKLRAQQKRNDLTDCIVALSR